MGSRPDGTDWRIGLRSPWEDGTLGVLRVSDCAVVTSGGYENYFEDEEGNVYWHILDPATGYPADSGLSSVTIITQCSMDADALSTASFVLGQEKAQKLLQSINGVEAVFIDTQDQITATDGIRDQLQ